MIDTQDVQDCGIEVANVAAASLARCTCFVLWRAQKLAPFRNAGGLVPVLCAWS